MNKVALYHCLSEKDIPETVASIIESLGKEKVSALFKNKRVLLKPNLCIDFTPDRGATTHPAVIDAMIAVAKAYGADVTVGDGPIVGVKGKIFEKTGVADVCKKHDVRLVNLNKEQEKRVVLDDALALHEANIAAIYAEMDTIVNLPIFKSNMLYWLSGALKNMKGFLVGTEKHRPHRIDVPKCVADLNRMVKQNFVLMDGFIGMMGDGPAAGNPANARLLIGGFDPVAVDAVAADLMGFPVQKIPMIQWAEKTGVGSTNYQLVGDPLDSFMLNFDKPRIAKSRFSGKILDAVQKFAFSFIKSKVIVDQEKCDVCGRCLNTCPFGAISIQNKAIFIDMKKCDICLCCHEACAQNAIIVKGLLSRTDAFLRGDII